MKVIRHHAVGQELHARKPRDASDEVHKPRTLLVVKKERTMGNTTNQVVTPVGKIDAATSHAGNYTTNTIYCGNLLWQPSLTLPHTVELIQNVLPFQTMVCRPSFQDQLPIYKRKHLLPF